MINQTTLAYVKISKIIKQVRRSISVMLLLQDERLIDHYSVSKTSLTSQTKSCLISQILTNVCDDLKKIYLAVL